MFARNTSRPLAACLALLFPAASLAAAPWAAPPQGELVLVDPVTGPEVQGVERGLTVPHPSGGVITVLSAAFGTMGSGFNDTLAVRWSSDLGDPVWTTFVDTSAPDLPAVPIDVAVGPGGEVAVLSTGTSTAPPQVDVLAPDGQLLWSMRIADPVTHVRGLAVAFTSTGHVAVTALALPQGFTPPYTLGIRFLDGATGAESARYEASVADGFATDRDIRATSMDGDVVATWIGAGGREVARVASDGTEVFRTTTSLGTRLAGIAATPQRAFVATETRCAAVDAGGTLLWERDLPVPQIHTQVVAVSPTEFATLHGCCWVSRIDANGDALWTHLSDGIGDTYVGIAAASGDEILTQGISQSTGRLAYEWLGAGGAEVARFDLPDLGEVLERVWLPAVDVRGNVWFASRPVPLGFVFPPVAYVLKIAVGQDQGTPNCTQPFPNSTGAVGTLMAVGSNGAARDNLTLVADDLPPLEFALFLNSRTAGVLPGPGGSQAVLCLNGHINRYVGPQEIRRASADGRASLQLQLPNTPDAIGRIAILAGETWYFQAWHRDPAAPAGSHMTDSIAVAFL